MKMLKQLFNFYINSSIHVALSVFSLTWITLLELDIPYDETLLLFVFFASISGYNFVKYFGIAKFHHRSLTIPIDIGRLKALLVFSLFSFIVMCYYAANLKLTTLFFIAGCGLITFFYAIPFLPRHMFIDHQHNLRSVGGLKVYLIALVWAGVTVFLPVINNQFDINADVLLTSLQRFIYIVVLMFPFEIRDLRYDSLKLATIPQKIGVKKTKIIGVALLVLFFFLNFLKGEIIFKRILISTLITMVTSLFLVYSKKEQETYYSSFWVEGLPILWLLQMLLIS
jgi:hypothetical protein